jgi:hypothetical protein
MSPTLPPLLLGQTMKLEEALILLHRFVWLLLMKFMRVLVPPDN